MIYYNGNFQRKFFKEHWIFCLITVIELVFLYEPALVEFQELIYGNKMPDGWDYNTTRDARLLVKLTETIINPKNICEDDPFLVIIVCSGVKNFNARQAIRKTWANESFMYSEKSVKIVFFLAKLENDPDNYFESRVAQESRQYNDIVQENFHDSYNNLTLKLVKLLKWTTTYCSKSAYMMKTDDDTFVNTPALVSTLTKLPNSSNVLMGALYEKVNVLLDSSNIWFMPRFLYTKRRKYPNYLAGSGYVMSLDVVKKLYEATLITPMVHLEDVYVTGFCAEKAGIERLNHYGFLRTTFGVDHFGCSLLEKITEHNLKSPEQLIKYSKRIKNLYNKKNADKDFCKYSHVNFYHSLIL